MIQESTAESKNWKAVFAEATALIAQCGFSQYRGDYRGGKTLSVLVDPRVDESGSSMDALVTCHVFGHRKTHWSGNVVALREENRPNGPLTFSFLNHRGQAHFTGLPPQGYRLSLAPYRQELWSAAVRIPSAGQIERQTWLESESVCRALAARAAEITSRKPGEPNDAFECILLLSGRLDSTLARPALRACLGILCDAGFPPDLRTSASGVFTPKSGFLLADIDLLPLASMLAKPEKARDSSEEADLEERLCGAFGAVLSARPSFGEGERGLISALVARCRSLETTGRARARVVRTRGPVLLRGPSQKRDAVRTRGATKVSVSRNPLFALIKAGGRRVQEALMEVLKEDKRNDNLLQMLKNLKTC